MEPKRLFSWNVNGLRAALRKGFLDFVEEWQPEVLCLQEVKALPEQVDLPLPEYHAYWNPAERKGYSGTLTLSKEKPLSVTTGMGIPEHDDEGRVICLEFPQYHLVNVYVPNSKRGLLRLDYRVGAWEPAFLKHVKKLEESKPVVICGDLNVAHKEIDLANPKTNTSNPGFTPEERKAFQNLLEEGFVDSFRVFNQEGGHYTWWSMRPGIRERNIGWRIDYFCVSKQMQPFLKKSFILPQVKGSDHCPIALELT